jgi:predicted nuclease with TOPRIM domain
LILSPNIILKGEKEELIAGLSSLSAENQQLKDRIRQLEAEREILKSFLRDYLPESYHPSGRVSAAFGSC